jgi:hypothetical protein
MASEKDILLLLFDDVSTPIPASVIVDWLLKPIQVDGSTTTPLTQIFDNGRQVFGMHPEYVATFLPYLGDKGTGLVPWTYGPLPTDFKWSL